MCCVYLVVVRHNTRHNPADKRRSHKTGSMLGQRRRWWANIEPALSDVSSLLGEPFPISECGLNHSFEQLICGDRDRWPIADVE